jgi:hypothetical protein
MHYEAQEKAKEEAIQDVVESETVLQLENKEE